MKLCTICDKMISQIKIKTHLFDECNYNYKYLFEIKTQNAIYIIGINNVTLTDFDRFIKKYIIKQNTYGFFYLKNLNTTYMFATYYTNTFCNYKNDNNIFNLLNFNSNVKLNDLYLINENSFEYILENGHCLKIKLLQTNDYDLNDTATIIWYNDNI